jgi:hypothetical protein
MATFDQLSAEQRAIIELVVQRGRTYEALADVLQVPASRVRELARDALAELSPVTVQRVDPQWRGQVADYLLGQQVGAESSATQNHLRKSEAARSWALSLLDALDNLYANGDRPAIPDLDESAARGGAAVVERPRDRERERERAGRTRRAERVAEDRDHDREAERKEPVAARDRATLSPAAQSALRRRRIIGAGVGAVVVIGLILGILALAGVFSSDNGSSSKAASGGSATNPSGTTGQTPQVLGQIPMKAVGGTKATGSAFILQQGNQRVLAVTAQLPPLPQSQRAAAYEVWLYNSPKDAVSVGAQFTDNSGKYQGVGPLPSNFQRYKFVDVSREPFDNNRQHNGTSVLRGAFADIQQPQQQGGQQAPGGQQGGGTGTTP